MSQNHEIEFAITAIRQYISNRPEAADTAEGIHHWWIQWPSIEETIAITQAALETMQQNGEMESITIANKLLWRKAKSR